MDEETTDNDKTNTHASRIDIQAKPHAMKNLFTFLVTDKPVLT